ncbi:DPP IV N-terminal domain-containing protein, partial [Bacteroides heparinolyticus]|uniref:DPP IV N-terminal domain-containing protein n=1 Tax=Prevotella heparinolytica TaxID=28113 RepID=UPI0035A183E2
KGHYVYDRSKHRLTKRKTVVGRLKFPSYAEVSPDSNWMVYALNHNLYLQKSGDTLKIRLTEDGERYYSYASEGGEQKTSPVKWVV